MKDIIRRFLVAFFVGATVLVFIVGVERARKVRVDLSGAPADNASTSDKAATTTQSETTAQSASTSSGGTNVPEPKVQNFLGDIYRIPWGNVQVGITVTDGVISEVTMPKVPSSPPSKYAAPVLISQATAAKSSDIQGVSGATYTSLAFERSLESAIARAGI